MPRSGKQGTPSSSETVDLANNEPFITNIYIHFNLRNIVMENNCLVSEKNFIFEL